MSWFKRDPVDLPENCPPDYVCLTTEQALKSCFDGGAPVAYGAAFVSGIVAGMILILLAGKFVQWTMHRE